jgi:hypothetical protein
MERPIEEYVKLSDTLAQDVVNAWGINMEAGNAPLLTEEFKDLFETTCQFRNSKMIADNSRMAGVPTEAVEIELEAKRQAFALSYKIYREKHTS